MKTEISQRTSNNNNVMNTSQLPSTILDRSYIPNNNSSSSNYRYLDKNLTEQIDHAV